MRRFTLTSQVALIVAAAIFLAQFLNLALVVDHRRDLAISQAIAPAAHRLALAAQLPERIEQREARPLRGARPMDARRAMRGLRARLHDTSPLPPGAERLPSIETILAARLDETGVDYRAVRVVRTPGALPGERREGLTVAMQMADGRWVAMRTPGPPSMRPLIGMLMLQSLMIGLAILLPTLLLLRQVGKSLARLRDGALAFDGAAPTEPVTPSGPRDIRALIEAINAMQGRIASMLAEKDVMLGAIGHDLRTPLTALRIEAEAVGDPAQRTALIGQIEALHAQFEQILNFARSGRAVTHREPRDLAPLIEEVAARFKASGQPVETLTPAPVRAEVDADAVARALHNLIENALRYARKVAVQLEEDRREVRIVVSDRGPGLSEEQKRLARMPFGRLDAARQRDAGGHGLGLAIVEAIARAHGGSLRLEDHHPGLRAVIALPRPR